MSPAVPEPGGGPPLPEVPWPLGTLVIADLHLDVEAGGPDPGAFVEWLARQGSAPRLVILGDLFEYWFGAAQERAPDAQRVLAGLRVLADRGCPVDLVPGNRDFLLGARFEELSGARVRARGLVGLLPDGGRVLALHGDELCTLDHPYQRLRRTLRSAPVLWLGRHLPRAPARALARALRRRSARAVAAKSPLDVAIQADEARRRLAARGCALLVCGHAHRWRDEDLGGGARLVVLEAFGGPRGALEVGPGGELVPRA